MVVFLAAAIDATSLPFPGRFILLIVGALATELGDAALLVLIAAAGTVIGDHVLYVLGTVGGDKMLSLYCSVSLGSARCVQSARDYFDRWGGLTIVIGRFVAGVRLYAAALAGAGGVSYVRFLLFDVLGALVWSAVFVLPGYWLGDRATRFLERFGSVALMITVTLAVVMIGLVVVRLWKRRRHKPATLRARRARARA